MGGNKKNVARDITNVRSVHIGDTTHIHNPDKPIPKALTNNIPLLSKEKIIGRDAYLDKLYQILNEKKDAVLVNGFGGVGKTTIAQVYAHTYWDEYAHVAWITLNSDDFIFEFVNAQGLKESLNISTEGADIKQLFDRIMVEINRIREKPNLLILDNAVEKLSQFKSYLPSTHEWHILVTAREEINGFTPHYLDFLDEADAITLFKHYYSLKIINGDQIHALVKKVEYHTLTIEILAKTAQLQRLSFDTLKDALQQDIKSSVRTSRSGQEKIKNITDYLSSIFSLSDLNENEIWVLKNMFCLPSDYHSYDLLHEIIDPAAVSKEDVFTETLTSLAQKTWLLYNEDTDSYKMHIVVAEVLKKMEIVRFYDVSSLIISLLSLLYFDQNLDNPVEKFRWIPISQSVSSKLNCIQEISKNGENTISIFESNLGLRLQDFGDYLGAKILLNRAMESDKKNFGAEHPSTAIRYSNLATVLQDLGEYHRAKGLFTKAMQLAVKDFGSEHPTTAMRYSNLALVLSDLGEFEEAKELLTISLQADEKNFGSDHPTTAVRYSNLATVLQKLGEYDKAKELLIKALQSDEKNFGSEHPATAKRYSNLATVLQDLGQYGQAKALLRKALQSDEKNFGSEHPSTMRSFSNLALVLKDLGEYDQAKVLLTKAMKSAEKKFGSEHPTTALGYSNLALVLKDLGEYDQAKVLLTKAMKSAEKYFGPDHPTTAISYSNLALVLQNLGDYEGAKALLSKALVSDEKKFGPDHPSTTRSYSNLALVLQDLGDYEGAKILLSKALVSDEKNFGPNHPTTAIRYSNLASLLHDMDEIPEAIILSKKALSIFKDKLPENHANIKTAEDIYNHLKSLK